MGYIYYYLAAALYSQNLDHYLLGFDGTSYTLPVLYDLIGGVTLGVSFLTMFIYYYVLDLTRFSSWWNWCIVLLINSVINLVIGYTWMLNHLSNGIIPEALVYTTNANGDPIQQITESGCLGFGFGNAIVAAIFFFVFSFVGRWWSHNCRYTPLVVINKKFHLS